MKVCGRRQGSTQCSEFIVPFSHHKALRDHISLLLLLYQSMSDSVVFSHMNSSFCISVGERPSTRRKSRCWQTSFQKLLRLVLPFVAFKSCYIPWFPLGPFLHHQKEHHDDSQAIYLSPPGKSLMSSHSRVFCICHSSQDPFPWQAAHSQETGIWMWAPLSSLCATGSLLITFT